MESIIRYGKVIVPENYMKYIFSHQEAGFSLSRLFIWRSKSDHRLVSRIIRYFSNSLSAEVLAIPALTAPGLSKMSGCSYEQYLPFNKNQNEK